MKKTLLLAGIAALVSMNARANYHMSNDVKPYIGADYVYSNVEYKNTGHKLPHSYNSVAGNLGVRMSKYFGPEFYYQHAFKRSAHRDGHKLKNRFFSYGMDMMGYLPLGCEGKWDALGSIGLGAYNVKTSYRGSSNDTNKVGYRGGLGVQYNMTSHLSARVMGRYTYIGTKYLDDAWEATAGLRYYF